MNPQEAADYYVNQLTSSSGQGARECFSSTGAMLASTYLGRQVGLEEYNRVRRKYGDSTAASSQIQALKEYGLNASVADDGSLEEIERLVREGKPVGIGVNHNNAGGHWLTVHGVNENGDFIVDDPYGKLKQQRFGGWEASNADNPNAGNNAVYGREFLRSIFEDRGKGTGRIMRIDGKSDGGLSRGGSGTAAGGTAAPPSASPQRNALMEVAPVHPLGVSPIQPLQSSAAGQVNQPRLNGLAGPDSGDDNGRGMWGASTAHPSAAKRFAGSSQFQQLLSQFGGDDNAPAARSQAPKRNDKQKSGGSVFSNALASLPRLDVGGLKLPGLKLT